MAFKKIVSSFLLVLALLTACSEKPESSERAMNEERLEELNGKDKFDYDREFEVEESGEPSIIWKILAAIGSLFAYLFQSFFGIVVLLLLVGLLVYIIVKNSDTAFIKKADLDLSPVSFPEIENIEEVNYEALLSSALKNNDFALAIRYHFLHCLKSLQKLKLINWHREKTNYEYLSEVPESYYDAFRRLINIYEHVWYGKFSATEETYRNLTMLVDQIQTKGGKS